MEEGIEILSDRQNLKFIKSLKLSWSFYNIKKPVLFLIVAGAKNFWLIFYPISTDTEALHAPILLPYLYPRD